MTELCCARVCVKDGSGDVLTGECCENTLDWAARVTSGVQKGWGRENDGAVVRAFTGRLFTSEVGFT